MTQVSLIVLAKDPQPGKVKTRLCPPCAPEQAAQLATAALLDTLSVVGSVPASRHVLVLAGDPARWRRHGFEILTQRGEGLGERLANAFDDVGGPALLVGMDTPQLTAELLTTGMAALEHHDAVLGPACDGGYWSIGLRTAAVEVFDGIPMSAPDTLDRQRQRLDELGLRRAEQPLLRDVDTISDARSVAALAPATQFAATLRRLW